MFSNIALPSITENTIPRKYAELNELSKQGLDNEILSVKARYAPLATLADAASKLSYANLVGPQFLAKLLGNENVLANMRNAGTNIDYVTNAALGAGSGMNFFNNSGIRNPVQPEGPRSLPGYLMDKFNSIRNMIVSPQQQNAITSTPLQSRQQNAVIQNPVQAAQDNQSYYSPATEILNESNPGNYSRDEIERAITAYRNNPEVQKKAQQEGFYSIPQTGELMSWYRNRNTGPGGVAENAARFQEFKERGKKLGTIQAEAIDDLDQQYQSAVQSEVPVNHLIEISQNPVFQQMRAKVPFFQDKQLHVLSKIGTPEEQKIIGDFITTTTTAVANTVQGFKGRALDKEFGLADRMKISPNDTWNTMIGKLASLATFNEMTKKRAQIASQLIGQKHMNRGAAIAEADKMIDGNAIRKSVEHKLDPKPTNADIEYMAKKYGQTPDEIRNRLIKKGYTFEIEPMGEQ